MSGAAWVTVLATLAIVLALVYYLVSTIGALRQITKGLDGVIASVGEIVEKSGPVNDVVRDINNNLDAGVDLLEGLLVQKAGLIDAVGLVEGLYPGAGKAGFRSVPRQHRRERAEDRRGLHPRDAHPGPAGPRGPDRDGQPGRPGDPQRAVRERVRRRALLGRPQHPAAEPAALAGDRLGLARAVRGA